MEHCNITQKLKEREQEGEREIMLIYRALLKMYFKIYLKIYFHLTRSIMSKSVCIIHFFNSRPL
jgi:hypothetical protein